MRIYLYAAAIGLAALLSRTASATPIDVTAGKGLPSDSLAAVLNFSDFPLGRLQPSAFPGGSLSGSQGATIGKANKAASPSLDIAGGSAVTFSFTSEENYFAMYVAALQATDSIEFLNHHTIITEMTGTDIASLLGVSLGGRGVVNPLTNRYINFNTGANFFDEVVLGSTRAPLRIGSIAFGDPPIGRGDQPASVPEPPSIGLLATFLVGLALFCRARRVPSAT